MYLGQGINQGRNDCIDSGRGDSIQSLSAKRTWQVQATTPYIPGPLLKERKLLLFVPPTAPSPHPTLFHWASARI